MDLRFPANLGFGHLVKGFDRDRGLFAAEFHEGDPTAGFQGPGDGGEHFMGMIDLMIHIDHEGEIEGVGGKFRVGFGAEDAEDVGDGPAGHVGGEQAEHFGLDIDGIDPTGGSDFFRHAPRVIAGAGADIGDDHAWLESEEIMEEVGTFLVDALGAFKPGGALVAHDLGDFAIQIEFSRAIPGGWAVLVPGGIGRGRGGGRGGSWGRGGGFGARGWRGDEDGRDEEGTGGDAGQESDWVDGNGVDASGWRGLRVFRGGDHRVHGVATGEGRGSE